MNRRAAVVFAASVVGGVLLSFAGNFTQLNAASTAHRVATRKAPVALKKRVATRKVPIVLQKPVAMSSKIVPIFSAGQGMRVGVARVTGPAANAKQVLAVGQIEATVMDVARVRIFIPVKTESGFDRVPQANVDAYADLKL